MDDIKKGESLIQIIMNRSKLGVKLHVWVHPSVEALMQQMHGELELINPTTFGRMWKAIGTEPLQAYWIDQTVFNGPLVTNNGLMYRLDKLGCAINLTDTTTGKSCINLSFIRLKGISEGQGVSFYVNNVMSTDAAREAANNIKLAMASFFISYMKNITFAITISSQELIG